MYGKLDVELYDNEYTKNIQISNAHYALNNYYKEMAYNFEIIFTEENIELCMKNSKIWNKVEKYIDDLSFTYFSCYKIFEIDNEEMQKKINIFEEFFKKNKNSFLYARIILMKWIYYYNLQNLDKLDILLNEIEGNKCKIEELERLFAESIIKIKENTIENLGRILSDIKEDKEYQKNNEKSFINIFVNKVKYIFCKYKIKNGIFEDNNLEELKDNKYDEKEKEKITKKCLAIIFKDEQCHFSEIKVYLAIAEWYLQKCRYGNNEDKDKFFDYLNFAFYIANFYNNYKINDNMNYFAETK